MDEEDKKLANEAVEDAEELPEAPGSITVRGYYKGYSMLITKRLTKNGHVKPLVEDCMKLVDWMESQPGFKNTWDKEEIPTRQVNPQIMPHKVYKTPEVMAAQSSCLHNWGPAKQAVGKWPGPWQVCIKCQKARLYNGEEGETWKGSPESQSKDTGLDF